MDYLIGVKASEGGYLVIMYTPNIRGGHSVSLGFFDTSEEALTVANKMRNDIADQGPIKELLYALDLFS